MVEHKCSNCYNFKVCEFTNRDKDLKYCFIPSEDAVRKDEREKVIQDIKNEFWINDGDNDFISIEELNKALNKYLKLREE